MFNLQARIHFKEIETAVRADDELNGSRAGIADGGGKPDRLFPHRPPHIGRDERGGCLLDHLLVAALDRTFAFTQIERVAMAVGQNLNFDMARLFDEFFDEDTVVAKAVQALGFGGGEPLAHFLLGIGEAHPLAAATRRRLHHHGIADVIRDLHGMVRVLDFADKAGDDGDACFPCQFLRFDLVAHRRNGFRGRADEGDARLFAGLDEAGAFRQEAIARMHGVRAGVLAGLNDLVR